MVGKRAVATTIAAGALIAGCGSSSSKSTPAASPTVTSAASFNQGFKTVTGELKQTSGAIATAIQTATSKNDAQLAAEFGGLATRWSAQTGQLSGLTPPASVSSQFGALTAAANRAGADLVAVSGAAGKHDGPAAKQATINLLHDILAAKAQATKIDSRLGIT
jgi:hypothetical protein